MKAVILAAGAGQRMFGLGPEDHKCLLQVGESSLIDRMMEHLIQAGIGEVWVVTGHARNTLERHLRTHFEKQVRFVHNPRFAETNNIVSLLCLLEQVDLQDDFLLLEADLIFDHAVLRRALQSPHPNVALVAPLRPGLDGTVADVRDGWVHDIIPPERQSGGSESYFKTVNIYKLSHALAYGSLLRTLRYYCQAFDEKSYYEKVFGLLIYAGQFPLKAEILQDEAWAELDDPQDLTRAQAIFDSQRLLNQLEYNFGGLWNFPVVDFNFIRNLYFPSDAMIEEMRQRLPELLHNYGSRQAVLEQKMATFLRCPVDPLIVLNGASQAYPILAEYFAGKKVLIPTPTFGEYPRVFPKADTFEEVPTHLERYDLVVLVNPNNPTGSILPTQTIVQWIDSHPHTHFLVDESFIDYSEQPSLMETLQGTPQNVIVLKSLGKSLGVPGLRMGFLWQHNSALTALFRARMPIWNHNSLAEFFLEIVLKHRTALARSFERTRLERQRFAQRLQELPGVVKVWPSHTNFLLVELDPDLDMDGMLRQMLRLEGLYLKDISSKFSGQRNFLRVAVRTPEEDDLLLTCWRRCAAILNPA